MLVVTLIAFIVLSALYSVVVPPFEASDELWHYPMVDYIAENWSLPVQDPANVGPWRQEGSQPPLYYFLSALATSWIDTSDMSEVRHLNPHVDNGIATPDGNVNLVVHHPEREAFPWQGTILAVHVVRFLSIAMAGLGVALTYFVVREVFPGRPALALGATAIHAFTPMVVFIAGSVNNDNLVVPLTSLALLMLLRLLRRQTTEKETLHQTATRYLPLGVVLGLAALTKASSLALTLITALVVVVRAVRRSRSDRVEGWKEFLIGGFATLLPVLAISGWWYLRNLRLYGDLTGLNAFVQVLGQREVPASLAQLWRERHSFLAGYWGNFGGLNVPMAPWVYRVLNASLVVAGAGLVITVVRSIGRTTKGRMGEAGRRDAGHETDASSSEPNDSPRTPDPADHILRLTIFLLLGLGVLIPWTQWARVTWSSQGRLVFAALPVWSLLIALGLSAWTPGRFGVGPRVAAPPLVILMTAFLLGLSAAAPFAWIRPAYALPEQLSDAQVQSIPQRTNVDFDDALRLLGYDLQTETTKPGGRVMVTLYWEALAPTEEDHTVFVHLLDEHELVVAQRDTFPGLGLLSTTWLDPGRRWADRYVIPVPATAYAPNQAEIEVGLFNTETKERLPVLDTDGRPQGDNVRFGHVGIEARPGDVPNPIEVNFGDRMLLTGYDLAQRQIRTGETITLTLHWEALQAMENNYTVSAQLIDDSQRKAAQHDGWPLDGAAPTAAWQPGHSVRDDISLTIFPNAAAGPYDVRIAVYVQREGKLHHLPVTPPGGRMQANHITLTQVRVTP
jgi:4-amino-4-deoxy-L-arabinose transferase-like glycosyltransferase